MRAERKPPPTRAEAIVVTLDSTLSASSRWRGPNPAARRHRADAIRAMRDCSKSAEPLYEPSELTSLKGRMAIVVG